MARLILSHTSFGASCPLDRSSTSKDGYDRSIRNQLFQTSIEALELSSLLLTDKTLSRWSWHSRTHIQWHAVAFVLSEICLRPPGPDCDRAWNLTCTVYGNWTAAKSEQEKKSSALSRAIKRLLAKAQYVRNTQQQQQQQDPSTLTGIDYYNGQSIQDMEELWDPLLEELLPDALYPWNMSAPSMFPASMDLRDKPARSQN